MFPVRPTSPSWCDALRWSVRDVQRLFCWAFPIFRCSWGWYVVFLKYLIQECIVTAVRNLVTNCVLFSVSRYVGVHYGITKFYITTVMACVYATVVTGRAPLASCIGLAKRAPANCHISSLVMDTGCPLPRTLGTQRLWRAWLLLMTGPHTL